MVGILPMHIILQHSVASGPLCLLFLSLGHPFLSQVSSRLSSLTSFRSYLALSRPSRNVFLMDK